MTRLTTHQQAVLDALRPGPTGYPALGPASLVSELDQRYISTTPEGAAATASSLVRRGLVERIKIFGFVHYQLVGAPERKPLTGN